MRSGALGRSGPEDESFRQAQGLNRRRPARGPDLKCSQRERAVNDEEGNAPAPGKSRGGGPRGGCNRWNPGEGLPPGRRRGQKASAFQGYFPGTLALAGLAWRTTFFSWVTEQQAAPTRAIPGPDPCGGRTGDPLAGGPAVRARKTGGPGALAAAGRLVALPRHGAVVEGTGGPSAQGHGHRDQQAKTAFNDASMKILGRSRREVKSSRTTRGSPRAGGDRLKDQSHWQITLPRAPVPPPGSMLARST
jgi:hypothetical protein